MLMMMMTTIMMMMMIIMMMMMIIMMVMIRGVYLPKLILKWGLIRRPMRRWGLNREFTKEVSMHVVKYMLSVTERVFDSQNVKR